jgi:hypothetical protein
MAMLLVETDARSRVVLPGHPQQRFLVIDNSDGRLLLQPAVAVADAQAEYYQSPELRDLLALAAAAQTVRRERSRTTPPG